MRTKNRKIISIFEPHRYSRVLSLKKEFAKSFLKSDRVLLCPIYAAGEKKIPDIIYFNLPNLFQSFQKQKLSL